MQLKDPEQIVKQMLNNINFACVKNDCERKRYGYQNALKHFKYCNF